ncbi:hypothetical protein [Flavobacterium sp.]|uniref:hypothetical protein n=1 Tax=Flavobacterium sp. TaxID=239 RepID=UPI00375199AA
MKRIIAILTLSLAFSLSSFGQQTKAATLDVKQSSSKDVVIGEVDAISKVIKLDEGTKSNISTLLFMRAEDMSNSKSFDEKKEIYERYGRKILGSLNDDQLAKIKANKELYTKLTLFPKI